MRSLKDLRPIQNVGVDFICNNPSAMLGLAMGFGKTAICLTAIRHLLDTFQVTHVLVIAPLLVAEETWPDEIDAWEHTSVLDYEVLTGPADRRENRARLLPEVTIINTENIGWLVELWGDDWPYNLVIIDEISRFKNPSKKTKPTKVAIQKVIDATMKELPKGLTPEQIEAAVDKAVKRVKGNLTRFGALCSVRKRIDRVVGLTGTMAPNGMEDIWSQYYLLDQGERLFGSYNQYRTRWFDSDYMGFKYTLRPGAFEQIVERIQGGWLEFDTQSDFDIYTRLNNERALTSLFKTWGF